MMDCWTFSCIVTWIARLEITLGSNVVYMVQGELKEIVAR